MDVNTVLTIIAWTIHLPYGSKTRVNVRTQVDYIYKQVYPSIIIVCPSHFLSHQTNNNIVIFSWHQHSGTNCVSKEKKPIFWEGQRTVNHWEWKDLLIMQEAKHAEVRLPKTHSIELLILFHYLS